MKLFHLEHKWQALSPLLQVPFRVQCAGAQILLQLSWADTLRQEALYITLSEKSTSYNFDHCVTFRYNIKSFWNESPIAEQLSLTLDLQQMHTLLIRQGADFLNE